MKWPGPARPRDKPLGIWSPRRRRGEWLALMPAPVLAPWRRSGWKSSRAASGVGASAWRRRSGRLAERFQPCETVPTASRHHGICRSLLHRWRRAARGGVPSRRAVRPRLLPVRLVAPDAAPASFIPPPASKIAPAPIKVVLRNGRALWFTATALRKAERTNRIAREPDRPWDIDDTCCRLVETADPARSPLDVGGGGSKGTPDARLKVAQLAPTADAPRLALDENKRRLLDVADGRSRLEGRLTPWWWPAPLGTSCQCQAAALPPALAVALRCA